MYMKLEKVMNDDNTLPGINIQLILSISVGLLSQFLINFVYLFQKCPVDVGI